MSLQDMVNGLKDSMGNFKEADKKVKCQDKPSMTILELISCTKLKIEQLLGLVESGQLKGDKGDKGDTGAKGDQGIQGIQGEKGEQGQQGIQGIQGMTGAKGDTGPGIYYKGNLTDVSQLPTNATEGDCYIVNQDAWIYSIEHGWQDVGHIVGPEGPAGPQGIQGIQGIAGPIGPKGEPGDIQSGSNNVFTGTNTFNEEVKIANYLCLDNNKGIFCKNAAGELVLFVAMNQANSFIIGDKKNDMRINSKEIVIDGDNTVFSGITNFANFTYFRYPTTFQYDGNALRLQDGGNPGHSYMEYLNYAGIRKGYIGYGGKGSTTMGISNSIGDIILSSNNSIIMDSPIYNKKASIFENTATFNGEATFNLPVKSHRVNDCFRMDQPTSTLQRQYIRWGDLAGNYRAGLGYSVETDVTKFTIENSVGDIAITPGTGRVTDINSTIRTPGFYMARNGDTDCQITPMKQDKSNYQWDKSLEFKFSLNDWCVEGKPILLSDTLASGDWFIQKYNYVHELIGKKLNVTPYDDGTIGFEVDLPYNYQDIKFCQAHITAVDGNYDDRLKACEWQCIAFKHPTKNTIKIQGKQITGTKPTSVDVEFLVKGVV